MEDVLEYLEHAAVVQKGIFFGLKNQVDFVFISVLNHLPQLIIDVGLLVDDLMLYSDSGYVESIYFLKDF
jgi:hypothetical protein